MREHKTRRIGTIEENISNNISGLCSCHFKARFEAFITGAVHHRMDSIINKTILHFTWFNTQRTTL